MEFLINNRRFSFLYNKKEINENNYTVEVKENGNELTTVYTYDSAMLTNFSFSERGSFCDTQEQIDFIKQYGKEYLMLRPYFSEDFYPLTEVTVKPDAWTAVQFDRPSGNDGILQIFRREKSPCTAATFDLYAIDEDAVYTFTDIDDNSEIVISGKELKKNGFSIEIKEKRCAKIFIYNK